MGQRTVRLPWWLLGRFGGGISQLEEGPLFDVVVAARLPVLGIEGRGVDPPGDLPVGQVRPREAHAKAVAVLLNLDALGTNSDAVSLAEVAGLGPEMVPAPLVQRGMQVVVIAGAGLAGARRTGGQTDRKGRRARDRESARTPPASYVWSLRLLRPLTRSRPAVRCLYSTAVSPTTESALTVTPVPTNR